METKKSFYGVPIIIVVGLLYALLGNFGLAAAQIALPAMAVDPAVTMDRTMLSLGFTIFVLMQGLPGPIIGKIVAERGAKVAFVASSVLIIATGILMAQFAGVSTVAYLVLFGVVLSFSSTLGGQVATQTTIGNWFVQKRGLAMAVTMCIGGVLGFAFPLITNLVIGPDNVWQNGFYLVSGVAVIALVVSLFFMKNKPADLGQEPDGGVAAGAAEKSAAAGAAEKPAASKVYKATSSVTQKQALTNPAFWFIFVPTLSIFMGLNMTVSAGVLHFGSLGLDSGTIALAVAVQGVAAVVVNLLVAPLADRIEPARMLAVCAFLVGLTCASAAFAGQGSVVLLFASYIFMGLGFGGNSALMPVAFANYFGIEVFPKLIGTVLLLLSLLSAVVPLAGGLVFTATGSYVGAYLVIMVICFIGAICGFLIKFPKSE